MPPWRQQLRTGLERLPASRRRRQRSLSPGAIATLQAADGTPAPASTLLDLASNDYLGLGRHPQLLAAARQALERDGVGSGGSRLVSGSRPVHSALERAQGLAT